MIIHAGEYRLRSFTLCDVEEFYRIAHEPKVKQYVMFAYPENVEECFSTVAIYSRGDCINDFYLAIEKENIMVGSIIAVRMEGKVLDVSEIISKEFRGQGIMTIAMKAFVEWLKDNTQYEELSFEIEENNVSSLRQAAKHNTILRKEHDGYKNYRLKIR